MSTDNGSNATEQGVFSTAGLGVTEWPERVLWYMRDNHTFRRLPANVDDAMAILRDEFDAGETYGMLCTKQGPMAGKNEHARKDWGDFEPRARRWLLAAMQPTAAEAEYASWLTPNEKVEACAPQRRCED